MGFWKNLRAVLRSPDIVAELEKERAAHQQLHDDLISMEAELDGAEMDAALLQQTLDRTATQLGACQAAVRSLCSQPPSAEELRRIYGAAAPGIDPRGFALYHAAESLTGIDVPSFFPYEDNRGMFVQMDGRQLLRYLTAARFGAVTWEAVPGTGHERAVLGTVDISTPEYQAFEQQIYGIALERMGFHDAVAPGQELRLYSRLSGQLAMPGYDGPEFLNGDELAEFQVMILHGIEDSRRPEEEQRGLMADFDGSDAVNEKVVSVFPSVEEVDGELYGAAVCRVTSTLSADELAELKEYCQCQYNDAWGEEFAQRPCRTRLGDLCVSFYVDSSDSILTKEELDAGRLTIRAPRQPKDRGEQHGR